MHPLVPCAPGMLQPAQWVGVELSVKPRVHRSSRCLAARPLRMHAEGWVWTTLRSVRFGRSALHPSPSCTRVGRAGGRQSAGNRGGRRHSKLLLHEVPDVLLWRRGVFGMSRALFPFSGLRQVSVRGLQRRRGSTLLPFRQPMPVGLGWCPVLFLVRWRVRGMRLQSRQKCTVGQLGSVAQVERPRNRRARCFAVLENASCIWRSKKETGGKKEEKEEGCGRREKVLDRETQRILQQHRIGGAEQEAKGRRRATEEES